MSFQHQLTVSLAGGSSTLAGVATVTADSKPPFDIDLTASQANKQVNVAIDVSELKSVYILPQAEITLATNSSSEPDDAFTIAAGVPFFWHIAFASWYPCPFTTDVTAFYLTNGADADNNVKIDILLDSTP